MPDPEMPAEVDFDSQLRGLFVEAAQQIQDRAPASGSRLEPETGAVRQAEEKALRTYASLPQLLRPMVLGLEAVSRATAENNAILHRLDKTAHDHQDAQRTLPQVVESLQALLEQKSGVNQRMFSALHEELKAYKDGFMVEMVLKPIVRDLIALLDDLNTIHQQMQDLVTDVAASAAGTTPELSERLQTMDMNVGHHIEFVVEILARLDVNMMPLGEGKLDKKTQRVVAVETSDTPEGHMEVIQTVKRGFAWKDRLLRAEEVIIKKWRGYPAAAVEGTGS